MLWENEIIKKIKSEKISTYSEVDLETDELFITVYLKMLKSAVFIYVLKDSVLWNVIQQWKLKLTIYIFFLQRYKDR